MYEIDPTIKENLLKTSDEHKNLLDNMNAEANSLYKDIESRIEDIITTLEGKSPSDDDLKNFCEKINYAEQVYMDILWKHFPIARVYPVEITKEKQDDDMFKFKLSMKFSDLTK